MKQAYKFKKIFIPFFILILFFNIKSREIKIVVDPQGDAQNIGRIINDGFERNLTLEVAKNIKVFFEYDRSINIIVTRSIGEIIEPLQNISFANRLNSDFYLNINICQNNKYDDNKIFIYYHILNPISDKWPKKFDSLSLIKIDDIYLKNISKTISFAEVFEKILKESTKKIYISSPIGAPLKNLIGLNCPALSCELLINSKEEIKDFIEPICSAIKKISESIS